MRSRSKIWLLGFLAAGLGAAVVWAQTFVESTQVVVVANLKPAKLMGLESQGMVLAATLPDGAPVLLRPLAAVPVGARVK